VFAIAMVQCTVVVDVKETCRAVGSVWCVAHTVWLLMVLPHHLRFVIQQAELTNASENKICPCFPLISILIHHGSERSLNPLKQDMVQCVKSVNAEITEGVNLLGIYEHILSGTFLTRKDLKKQNKKKTLWDKTRH